MLFVCKQPENFINSPAVDSARSRGQ
jgi:hypothetical protein